MVRAGSSVVRFRRRRMTTAHAARWRRSGRAGRTRAVSGRARWLLESTHRLLLQRAWWALSAMLRRRTDALPLVIGIKLLRWQSWITNLS